MAGAPPVTDIHSFARPADARVTHVSLDLTADFDAHVLSGSATLTFERRPGVRELVLDTRGLDIARVVDHRYEAVSFTLQPAVEHLGQALTIALPTTGDRVRVEYRTRPDAAALQWLTPAQTAGKRYPYLYSQGQAILTRTWIPTQDSPGIRQTYDAAITVPRPLKAVMAAEMLTPDGEGAGDTRTFRFRMEQAIPPYLIALAAGDIAFRQLGPRTGVYTEPVVLDRAANELDDIERMVSAAETLGGPYRWGRFDVLVLPPSFPFGGMENPRLTFATPTILAGDRSLVSLLAHELAHSWSGNLVTNATWGDFWLNEGVTTYFENRIMEALYGPERAQMLASLGRGELTREMAALPAADTKLALDLQGRDPDDGMTSVAYEKGAALLHTIERAVGRDRFDPWLRGYFNRHAFTSITAQQFVTDLEQELFQGDEALRNRLAVREWIEEPGLPASAAPAQSPAFAQVDAEAQRFAGGARAASLAVTRWTPQQWQHFLERLRSIALTHAQLRDLDTTFSLSASGNSEILFAWLRVAVARQHDPAVPALERFLSGQGRRKYLRPLYEDLMQTPWGQPIARRTYAQARASYHAVSARTLDAIVTGESR
ncbi:MAG: M1 family metallopeptidase [Acidobacteria bacterium]|nr:M1 family metallopeptidase [Acidobacteriota bacterium]